jgi:hypothetical protein
MCAPALHGSGQRDGWESGPWRSGGWVNENAVSCAATAGSCGARESRAAQQGVAADGRSLSLPPAFAATPAAEPRCWTGLGRLLEREASVRRRGPEKCAGSRLGSRQPNMKRHLVGVGSSLRGGEMGEQVFFGGTGLAGCDGSAWIEAAAYETAWRLDGMLVARLGASPTQRSASSGESESVPDTRWRGPSGGWIVSDGMWGLEPKIVGGRSNKGLQRTGAEGARGLPPPRVITNGAHSARLR